MSSPERTLIVVLLGIHGSGKSTLGKSLGRRGFNYFPEIGFRHRKKVGGSALDSSSIFDENIMREELARDEQIIRGKNVSAVETWHFGNIAYALARGNQKVAEKYERLLQKKISRFLPILILLKVKKKAFLQRATENTGNLENAWKFYNKVFVNLVSLAREYRVPCHIIDANESREKVLSNAMAAIQSYKN